MSLVRKLSRTVAASAVMAVVAQSPVGADVPDVVVSILPIHSLVAGVMDGVGTPTLLVKGGGSPHAYTLRPSEAQALQGADLVFWVGEDLETFLGKALRSLPRKARVVALHEAEGVTLLSYREGGAWEEHADDDGDDHDHGHKHDDGHKHDHGHKHGDEHAHGAKDMHIWLDPTNAQAMVAQVVAILSEVDPANAPRYRANATAVHARLAELDAALAADLAAVKGRRYVVFHDAYQYFENRYGLTPAGSITVSPDRQPSAGRLAEIRAKIAATGAACVFAEPQFEPALVKTVIEGSAARTGILDPLGADLAPGPDAYIALMRDLATSLNECLRSSS
ncbi:MAG: zinc ABC transporter substrate-binding protein ZnuA [Rhodospirillales bacterium]